MRRLAAFGMALAVLAARAPAQGSGDDKDTDLSRRVSELERELRGMKDKAARDSGWGSASEAGLNYLPQTPAGEADKIKFSGRLDFEFYDSESNRNNLGNYGGNQFGLSGGPTEFRVRRLQLGVDVEMISDFLFHGLLTLDPVVRDEDEGSVDIDEAYARFSNIVRNLLNFEDPSHTYVLFGNHYRWERDFLPRWLESFSMAGTSFYRDEVAGLEVGGDFEEGPFYRVGLDNGSVITARDAGVGARAGAGGSAVGNAPIFHDNEQIGDLNNNKDVSFGLGWRDKPEGQDFHFRIAGSYRHGKLSSTEQTFLSSISPAYFGSKKQRFGVMGGLDYDFGDFILGGDGEFWVAQDGNGDRQTFAVAPYAKMKLDGVYYQDRLFFTGLGLGYRYSYMHQTNGFANAAPLTLSILDDRMMHTITTWLEVTRNVDLRVEMNNFESTGTGRDGSDTEWMVQLSTRF